MTAISRPSSAASMGIDGAGVAAVWEAGELIRDPYSGAAKGEVALDVVLFMGFRFAARVQFRARSSFDA